MADKPVAEPTVNSAAGNSDSFIANPVINSPFFEPDRHYRIVNGEVVNELLAKRRPSSEFVPIPKAQQTGPQLQIGEGSEEDLREIENINTLRDLVANWGRRAPVENRYQGTTQITRRLLDHWNDEENRHRRLFFCQIEAIETTVFLTEAIRNRDLMRDRSTRERVGGILTNLTTQNRAYSNTLNRVAHKMATGSGKTVLMAMLIVWQTLNHTQDQRSELFTNKFLVVTPGITIRDRLRVLRPSEKDNYYGQFDLVPAEYYQDLKRAKVVVTNFHSLQRRSKTKKSQVPKIAHHLLQEEAYRETEGEMAARVCREFGLQGKGKQKIMVINDEAHHCYRRRLDPSDESESEFEQDTQDFDRDEKREREEQQKEARVWINGLEIIDANYGISTVFDLSATPFFLAGSGEKEGTLFPWVVSDFSLMDAIECGIVKIPQVPVADSTSDYEISTITNRQLWEKIKDDLPRGTRRQDLKYRTGPVVLPAALEGAVRTLYHNYEEHHRAWENSRDPLNAANTPPVFIIVCSNTQVSKLVYDWVAGHKRLITTEDNDGPPPPPGGFGFGKSGGGSQRRWSLGALFQRGCRRQDALIAQYHPYRFQTAGVG